MAPFVLASAPGLAHSTLGAPLSKTPVCPPRSPSTTSPTQHFNAFSGAEDFTTSRRPSEKRLTMKTLLVLTLVLVASTVGEKEVRRLRFRRPKGPRVVPIDDEEGVARGRPVPLNRAVPQGVPVDQLVVQEESLPLDQDQDATSQLLATALDDQRFDNRRGPPNPALQSLLATAADEDELPPLLPAAVPPTLAPRRQFRRPGQPDRPRPSFLDELVSEQEEIEEPLPRRQFVRPRVQQQRPQFVEDADEVSDFGLSDGLVGRDERPLPQERPLQQRRPAPGIPRRRRPRPQEPSAGNTRRPASDQETRTPPVGTVERYSHTNEDGSFTFGYVAEDGSFREETRGVDCITRGKYGYVDPEGKRREFTYVSGLPCELGEENNEDSDTALYDDLEEEPIRQDPIAPADRFRTSQAVQLEEDELPQRRRPTQTRRRPRPQQASQDEGALQSLLDVADRQQPRRQPPRREPVRRPPAPNARPTRPTPRPEPRPELRPEPRPQPRPQFIPEPRPEPRPQFRPEPRPEPRPTLRPTARPVANRPGSFDFDAAFDDFTLNRPAITFEEEQRSQRPQRPREQDVGRPNFSSELVFDPESGTFQTELNQNVGGGQNIRLANANAPATVARPQTPRPTTLLPTRPTTPRPTTPRPTAPRPTTPRPTAPRPTTPRPIPPAGPIDFEPLNFPDPSTVKRPPPTPTRPPVTPTRPPVTPTRPPVTPTRPPTIPALTPTRPATPRPTTLAASPRPTTLQPTSAVPTSTFANGAFFQQPTRPVARPPTPTPFSQQPQQLRPQPQQLRPQPQQLRPQPQQLRPQPQQLRPQQLPGQQSPALSFGFQPLSNSRPTQPARPPFTAFSNGVPPQLQGAPPPRPPQAPQNFFGQPGQQTVRAPLGIPPQLQLRQQPQQNRFGAFGRPQPQQSFGGAQPPRGVFQPQQQFAVFNPNALAANQ